VLPTAENESLLLRTPISSEAEGGAIHPDDAKAGGHNLKLGWQVLALGGHIEPKLPTPNTMDHLPARTGEALDRARRRGDGRENLTSISNLREAVVAELLPKPRAGDRTPTKKEIAENDPKKRLEVAVALLPTPQASDGPKGGNQTPERRIETGHQVGMTNLAPQLTDSFGKFAPAIHRWETITGNPAPAPTIPDGRDGQHRLNPAFAEWMMGLEPGWVTGCDITRNEMLKACGNGVVPQQAAMAISMMLEGKTL